MQALASLKQQGIFEKVVRAKDGRLYNVCFEIVEVAGQIRARVISACPVSELKGECVSDKKTYTSLPGFSVEPPPTPKEPEFQTEASPFFSELDFFVSQMTRAPAVKA